MKLSQDISILFYKVFVSCDRLIYSERHTLLTNIPIGKVNTTDNPVQRKFSQCTRKPIGCRQVFIDQ